MIDNAVSAKPVRKPQRSREECRSERMALAEAYRHEARQESVFKAVQDPASRRKLGLHVPRLRVVGVPGGDSTPRGTTITFEAVDYSGRHTFVQEQWTVAEWDAMLPELRPTAPLNWIVNSRDEIIGYATIKSVKVDGAGNVIG